MCIGRVELVGAALVRLGSRGGVMAVFPLAGGRGLVWAGFNFQVAPCFGRQFQ